MAATPLPPSGPLHPLHNRRVRRRAIFALPALFAQEPDVDFICPMDRDVHAKAPGKCPRCGMRLVAGLPDPIEYPVELAVTPRRIKAAEPLRLDRKSTRLNSSHG